MRERFLFLLPYLSKHAHLYLIGIICVFLTNWMAVTIPEYIQKSIDLLSEDMTQAPDELLGYLQFIFILAFGMVGIRTFSRIFIFNPGRAIECELKEEMFERLMTFQKEYYEKNPSGNIISRINNDIHGVRLLCGFCTLQFFNILSALSLTPFKMWQLSPSLTLYCLIPILLAFSFVRYGMKFLIQSMNQKTTDLQELSGFIVSSLSGVDILRSFGMWKWSESKFLKMNQSILDRLADIFWVRAFVMPVLSNLEGILKLLVLFIGGAYVIQEDFTIGELTAFMSYAGLLTMPLMGLGWLTSLIQQGFVGLDSIRTVFDYENPVSNPPSRPKEEVHQAFQKGGMRLQHLQYRHEGQTQDTLNNLSFDIKPGQIVGVLGKLGSGKTTLANCLNRYLKVERGQIFIGDLDICDLSEQDLRSVVRTVTQEPFLISDTIEENILFEQVSDRSQFEEQLPGVLKQSALTEEVERFSEGTQTLVGERGIMLSGGQKQRISLARALLAPCDLLILDNVLSAVDYETERFLLDQIFSSKHAQSLLIISHRVRAVENADWIIILEDGTLAEQGTHETLMRSSEFYRKTWELQNEN